MSDNSVTASMAEVDEFVTARGFYEFLTTRKTLVIDGKPSCLRCRKAISQPRVDSFKDGEPVLTCVTCHGLLEKLDPTFMRRQLCAAKVCSLPSSNGLGEDWAPRGSRRKIRAEGSSL